MIAHTALTLLSLFFSAPLSVIPLLDRGQRMDMVDLYEAGQSSQVGNRYGGVSELSVLTDSLLEIRLTEVSSLELRLLPDTTLSIRHTVVTSDSVVHTQIRHFTPTFQVCSNPS